MLFKYKPTNQNTHPQLPPSWRVPTQGQGVLRQSSWGQGPDKATPAPHSKLKLLTPANPRPAYAALHTPSPALNLQINSGRMKLFKTPRVLLGNPCCVLICSDLGGGGQLYPRSCHDYSSDCCGFLCWDDDGILLTPSGAHCWRADLAAPSTSQ